jgi:hypothetical protein
MNTKIPQGLKTAFLIHFIISLLFGLGFLLIPVAVGNLFGLNVQDPSIYRLLGAAILGFAVSSWLSYQATEWESVRIVLVMEIVWATLGTLVLLYALLFAGFPALGALNAVILAAFAIAFGWFYFRR